MIVLTIRKDLVQLPDPMQIVYVMVRPVVADYSQVGTRAAVAGRSSNAPKEASFRLISSLIEVHPKKDPLSLDDVLEPWRVGPSGNRVASWHRDGRQCVASQG
jgi:hypothetical protein